MRILKRSELDKVAPKFRQMVVDSWDRGEIVPWGVVLLSDQPLTKKDVLRAGEIARRLKLKP